jgi:hypothetical protein
MLSPSRLLNPLTCLCGVAATAFRGTDLAAAIRALFANNEKGVWYDPSDFSAMFQDSTGITPVTAVGQPVGLLLDKSKGLVLGSELVTNGDFSNGITGWTPSNATLTVINGEIEVNVTSAWGYARQVSIPGFVVGRTYEISGTLRAGTVTKVRVNRAAGETFGSTTSKTNTQFTYRYVATATTLSLELDTEGAVGTAYFDNISVKELPGNHATQATSTSRPILARHPATGKRNLMLHSENLSDGNWIKLRVTASGQTVVEDTTTNSHVISNYTPFVPTPSTPYTVSCDVKANGRNYVALEMCIRGGNFGLPPANSSTFDLTNGTVGRQGTTATASIVSLGDGWYRIRNTVTTVSNVSGESSAGLSLCLSATDQTRPSYLGDGVSGVLTKNLQVELGSTATAYQKTTTIYDTTEAGVADLHYLQFDGVDDGLAITSIIPSSLGLGAVWSFWWGIKWDAGTQTVFGAAAATSGRYILAAQQSSTSARSDSGAPTVRVNQTVIPAGAAPRGDLYTALTSPAGSKVMTVTEANLMNYTTGIFFGAYSAYTFNGKLYSLIIRGASPNADQIAAAESYVNSKTKAYA